MEEEEERDRREKERESKMETTNNMIVQRSLVQL